MGESVEKRRPIPRRIVGDSVHSRFIQPSMSLECILTSSKCSSFHPHDVSSSMGRRETEYSRGNLV